MYECRLRSKQRAFCVRPLNIYNLFPVFADKPSVAECSEKFSSETKIFGNILSLIKRKIQSSYM